MWARAHSRPPTTWGATEKAAYPGAARLIPARSRKKNFWMLPNSFMLRLS